MPYPSSAASTNNGAYLNYKNQCISYYIQLSRNMTRYNTNMLISTLNFWEGSTNTFQLPCGMITPTLFDVDVITSLILIGGFFDPNLKNKIKYSFSFRHPSFNAYIKDHHDQIEEVSATSILPSSPSDYLTSFFAIILSNQSISSYP